MKIKGPLTKRLFSWSVYDTYVDSVDVNNDSSGVRSISESVRVSGQQNVADFVWEALGSLNED